MLLSTEEAARERKKHRPKQETQSIVSPYFMSTLAASQVLYNKTGHIQGFFIFLMTKNSVKSHTLLSNFQNKLLADDGETQRRVLYICALLKHAFSTTHPQGERFFWTLS